MLISRVLNNSRSSIEYLIFIYDLYLFVFFSSLTRLINFLFFYFFPYLFTYCLILSIVTEREREREKQLYKEIVVSSL